MKLYILLSIIVLVRVLTYATPVRNGDLIRVRGVVNREPVVYDTQRQIEVEGIKAYIPKYPEVYYGDKIVLEGTYKDGKLEKVKVVSLEASHNLIYGIRNSMLRYFQEVLPEPHASLVSGVVLGSKTGLSEHFWEDLKNTGTAHVVVASGMNVTLVGGFLLNSLISITDRRKALVGVVLGIWLYTLMAGFDAPIIRAAIMGTIAFTAQGLGRLNNALRALFASGAVMLILNPLWIRDVGFQLSFTATAALILLESKVERLIYFVPRIIRQDLATTLAAQLGVAPLLFYYFKSVNLFSPIINALVLWTIPLVTIGGMLAGIAGLVIPVVGKVLLFLVYPLTSWFVFIVGLGG